MSGDPLPLPEIWSDLPDGTADESARSEFAANGHSGLVLIEYASGYAQPDLQPFARPLDRVAQPAVKERLRSLVPAAVAKGLADLVAIVTQAEALLRAQGILKGEVHFAVERIHDVAMALRMRNVDVALCDTLEASVREVGDAVVRHEAAATGALSAAALLRDVMRRIEDLTVVASRMAAAGAEPLVGLSATEAEAAIETPALLIAEAAIEEPAPRAAEVLHSEEVPPQLSPAGSEAEVVDRAQAEAGDTPVAGLVDNLIADDEHARSQLETVWSNESSEDALPETQAIATPPADALEDDAAERGEAPAIAAANDQAAEPVESQATALPNDGAVEPAESPMIAVAKDEVAEPAESVAIAAPNDEVVERIESMAVAAAKDEVVEPAESMTASVPHPQQKSNAAPAESESEGEAASTALAAEPAASVVAETPSEQEPPRLALSSFGESGTAAASRPLRPANDPLAALYGLSEEELIALFC